MLKPEDRIAILLHQGIRSALGKTGLSLLRYSESDIVAVIDQESAGSSLPELTKIQRQVPIVASVEDSLVYKPNVLVIGIAPSGGAIPPEYRQEIYHAVSQGLSIVNGLHTPIANDPDVASLLKPGQWIWDIRQEPSGIPIASAKARSLACLRVLTVGTDMGIGKMSTSLELNRAALKKGYRSKFIATGQAGLMIAQDGIPLDAIRVDFAAGAVEQVVMHFGQNHDILQIEGQGSLLHPGSTATLPLLRGSQATHLVLVHRVGQTHIRNHPHILIPSLTDVIKLYEAIAAAGGAFTPAQVVAIALNTHHLDETEAISAIAQVQLATGLPCTDPVRFGADLLLNAIV